MLLLFLLCIPYRNQQFHHSHDSRPSGTVRLWAKKASKAPAKATTSRIMMFAHGKERVSSLAAPPDGYGVKSSNDTRPRNFTTL